MNRTAGHFHAAHTAGWRRGVVALLLGFVLQAGAAAQATSAPAFNGSITRFNDDTYLFNVGECTHEQVINEFCRVAGLKLDRQVEIDGSLVGIKSHTRLTLDEAVRLVSAAISDEHVDIAAVRDGDTLKIVTRDSLRFAALSMERAFVLERIAIDDDHYVAYINNTYEEKTLQLKQGDKVAKGTLMGIVSDHIEYVRDGEMIQVYVGCDLTGAAVQLNTRDNGR